MVAILISYVGEIMKNKLKKAYERCF